MPGDINDGIDVGMDQTAGFVPPTSSGNGGGSEAGSGPGSLSDEDIARIVAALTLQLGAVATTLEFVDAAGEPVPHVRFSITGAGQGQAGSGGLRTISLDPGDYTVLPSPRSGIVFAPVEITVVAGVPQTVIIPGQSVVYLPRAQDLDLCRCVFRCAMLSTAATESLTRTFTHLPQTISGQFVTGVPEKFDVDRVTREIDFLAPRGSWCKITASTAGIITGIEFQVPDLAEFDLAELLQA